MNEFMTNVGYPFVSAVMIGLVSLGITWTKQRLNIQADATANATVQNAVDNFAGKVMLDVAAGKLTLDDVKAGKAVPALMGYVNSTVADSLKQLGVTPATLATMLVGKIGARVGVNSTEQVP